MDMHPHPTIANAHDSPHPHPSLTTATPQRTPVPGRAEVPKHHNQANDPLLAAQPPALHPPSPPRTALLPDGAYPKYPSPSLRLYHHMHHPSRGPRRSICATRAGRPRSSPPLGRYTSRPPRRGRRDPRCMRGCFSWGFWFFLYGGLLGSCCRFRGRGRWVRVRWRRGLCWMIHRSNLVRPFLW